jgi:microcystin-dependent protein
MKLTHNKTIHPSDYPTGSIGYFLRTSVPSGWVIADGSAANKLFLSNLFNKIGYSYGFGGVTRTNPFMTSATAPSGNVYYSTQEASTYFAWKAFNGVTNNDCWQTTSTTGWIAYKFTSPKIINGYGIKGYDYSSQYYNRNNMNWHPKTWTLLGSNDTTNGSDGTWVTLDTQTNQTNWTYGENRYFYFNNSTSYTTYKLNITANNGHGSVVGIGELELYDNVALSQNLFSLPDLRGEFVCGYDGGRGGTDAGRLLGTFQNEDMAQHAHYTYANYAFFYNHLANVNRIGWYRGPWITTGLGVGFNAIGGSSTRPRNIALLPCIKI